VGVSLAALPRPPSKRAFRRGLAQGRRSGREHRRRGPASGPRPQPCRIGAARGEKSDASVRSQDAGKLAPEAFEAAADCAGRLDAGAPRWVRRRAIDRLVGDARGARAPVRSRLSGLQPADGPRAEGRGPYAQLELGRFVREELREPHTLRPPIVEERWTEMSTRTRQILGFN
jgi:hypothetical protein